MIISVVDDNPATREQFCDLLDVADQEAISLAGPLGSLSDCVKRVTSCSQAAVCDHKLSPRNYANFDGIQLVEKCYLTGFPAVLWTTFSAALVASLRKYRRHVPVVFPADVQDPDVILAGITIVSEEIKGNFVVERRPWKAQVKFVDRVAETRTLMVKVPGWSDEALGVPEADIPADLLRGIKSGEIVRCRANVNLGATSGDDLYLEWLRDV